MDNLIAQDADLIDVLSGVTEADREVLIRLSNPDDETAQRIRRGLIYTWEAGQIANHREQAAAEERAKIVAWLKDIDPYALACGVRHACANAIEAREHLK